MSFLDIQFPPNISFHAIGGPGFLTNVVIMNSGKESRSQVWSLERGEWDVSHAAREPADYKPLQAFFRVVRGRAYSFRFKDWSDFSAAAGEGLFIDADGSPSAKQMIKRYTFGSDTFDRVITKPISGLVTTDASGLDYTTGIASSGTAWNGQFDCHARFDTDKMKAETIDKKKDGTLVIGWSSITIIEIR